MDWRRRRLLAEADALAHDGEFRHMVSQFQHPLSLPLKVSHRSAAELTDRWTAAGNRDAKQLETWKTFLALSRAHPNATRDRLVTVKPAEEFEDMWDTAWSMQIAKQRIASLRRWFGIPDALSRWFLILFVTDESDLSAVADGIAATFDEDAGRVVLDAPANVREKDILEALRTLRRRPDVKDFLKNEQRSGRPLVPTQDCLRRIAEQEAEAIFQAGDQELFTRPAVVERILVRLRRIGVLDDDPDGTQFDRFLDRLKKKPRPKFPWSPPT